MSLSERAHAIETAGSSSCLAPLRSIVAPLLVLLADTGVDVFVSSVPLITAAVGVNFNLMFSNAQSLEISFN